MFKLRQEHLDAFGAQVATTFTTRVVAHVKAVWPTECGELGDAAVLEMVRGSIQRAVALGLVSEFDVVRFVDLGFILVKDFESNPYAAWTRPLLADRALGPEARMDRVYQRMNEEFALVEKRKSGRQA